MNATRTPAESANRRRSAGRPGSSSIESVRAAPAISAPCTALPMPKAASVPNRAKMRARGMKRLPRPFLMVYIGPPSHCPSAPRSRKRTASVTSANFVAMPSMAVSQSQKSVPGPPRAIARATPAMFPVPTVPASAEHTA